MHMIPHQAIGKQAESADLAALPEDLQKALKKIQNGSILLFHAQKKDSLFLDKLIPELQARGFEMVTLSEMFGFDPPERSDELYVYNRADYENK